MIPILTTEDRRLFGRGTRENRDTLGYLDGAYARFGRSYCGAPDLIAAELVRDEAISAAGTLLLTVPNHLGVDYNARLLETVAARSHPRSAGIRPRREATRPTRRRSRGRPAGPPGPDPSH